MLDDHHCPTAHNCRVVSCTFHTVLAIQFHIFPIRRESMTRPCVMICLNQDILIRLRLIKVIACFGLFFPFFVFVLQTSINLDFLVYTIDMAWSGWLIIPYLSGDNWDGRTFVYLVPIAVNKQMIMIQATRYQGLSVLPSVSRLEPRNASNRVI